MVGTSQGSFSQALKKDVRLSTLQKIADALNMSVSDLLRGMDEEGTTDIESSAPAETEEGTTDIETRIRYYAHVKGLKLYELANKIGLSSSGSFSLTIRKDMRLSTLQKIADALCVPISALLEDEPKKTEAAQKFICPRCGALLNIIIQEETESPEKAPKTDK